MFTQFAKRKKIDDLDSCGALRWMLLVVLRRLIRKNATRGWTFENPLKMCINTLSMGGSIGWVKCRVCAPPIFDAINYAFIEWFLIENIFDLYQCLHKVECLCIFDTIDFSNGGLVNKTSELFQVVPYVPIFVGTFHIVEIEIQLQRLQKLPMDYHWWSSRWMCAVSICTFKLIFVVWRKKRLKENWSYRYARWSAPIF